MKDTRAQALLPALITTRTIDAELAALLWLLVEGGTPLIVTGRTEVADRSAVATAVLSADPERAWVLVDADSEPPTTQELTALIQGGVGLGITLDAADLPSTITRLENADGGLAEDAVRRLGVVVVADRSADGLIVTAVHYLRPTERDAQGHVQRRPPAILATWDAAASRFDHYAWGITPELADRVDRAQADFEERQADRAGFLHHAAAQWPLEADAWATLVRTQLAEEPPRVPAPEHEPAKPSPLQSGLTDPDPHVH